MNTLDWLIGNGIEPTRAVYNALDRALDEQRVACGDAVSDECDKINITYGTELIILDDACLLVDACLNATG